MTARQRHTEFRLQTPTVKRIGGVEVKVTRASRDRGVDAILFDPNPLRGGKYVLQAKRYTRTVDVSAVRDLYGTVMNEGANRGVDFPVK